MAMLWVLLASLLHMQTQGLRTSVVSGSTASRNAFEYMRALQAWKQAVRRGMSCPAPAACSCHCDCAGTKYEKPPPPADDCPTYPTIPTLPPPPTTPAPPSPVKTTPAPEPQTTKVQMQVCKENEVARADGTCSPITKEVIAEVRHLVLLKKEFLDSEQERYDGHVVGHLPTRDLLIAHEEYRKALDLLLALLAMMKPKPKPAPAEEAAAAEAVLGPEFVEGEIGGKVECEKWMSNATHGATKDDCGIICRNEPMCAGFAVDPSFKWCAWFKRLPPKPQPGCTVQKTQYVKRRNVTINDDLWAAVAKIHAMDEQLQTMMLTADEDAQTANGDFHKWMDSKNKSAKAMLKWTFTEAKNEYTFTLQDAAKVQEERDKAIWTTWDDIHAEQEKNPAFKTTTTTTEEEVAAPPAEAPPKETSTTTTTTPRPLMWSDFPNSADTQWSLQHPECPMGPPCFCNCKCKGSPPQNFIEPPAPPPAPCPPPPPTPDPSRLSLPLGAPPATPLR